MAFKVFRRLQQQDVRIQGFGNFDQGDLSFQADGADSILCLEDGEEVFMEPWGDILKEDGTAAGTTQQEVLDYLDDQLIEFRVSARYGNSDIITNLNTTAGAYTGQLVPIFGNELKASDYFTKVNDTTIQCNFGGEIVIMASIGLFSAGQRPSLQARLVKNASTSPVGVGPESSTGYIRNLNNHQEASLHLMMPAGVSNGDEFSVGIRRESNVLDSVTMPRVNVSQFGIYRIR